jgi:SAM-dependent methyltransferase
VLRAKEGWVGEHGREDPDGGRPSLWRGRTEAVMKAARIVSARLGTTPLVLDVGSGGGWAAGMLGGAEVIAIDLLEAGEKHGLAVRGDMRRLPVRDGVADAALYVASLHHAPVAEAVSEAARVLRPDGLLIALDSPIYNGPDAAQRAAERSAAYYAGAGHPELAAAYHPIEAGRLRGALVGSGFEVLRLGARSRWRLWRPGPGTFVLARRLR